MGGGKKLHFRDSGRARDAECHPCIRITHGPRTVRPTASGRNYGVTNIVTFSTTYSVSAYPNSCER